MPILRAFAAALAWVGRQGTRALAISLFLGLALPQLAEYVKPYLGLIVFIMLLCSYLRTNPAAFLGHFKSPGLTIAASLWMMVATPLVFGAVYTAAGLRDTSPGLYQIMILQLAVSPITSSAAFAGLMGLDVALTLVTLIVSSAISPLSTMALSYLFLGTSVINPVELGIKLFFFFATSGAVAYAIRRIAGQAWVDRQSDVFDGVSVTAAFVFAIAVMGSVPGQFASAPLYALSVFALGTLVIAVLIVLTFCVFIRVGANRSLALGLLAGFRNLGVIMAAVGATLPEIAWFYFAAVQFPIYLFPVLLSPLARRFTEKR